MSIFEKAGGLLFFSFLEFLKNGFCEHNGKDTEILIIVYAVEKLDVKMLLPTKKNIFLYQSIYK